MCHTLDNKSDKPLLCHLLSTLLSLASLCACPLTISCGTALWAHVEGGALLGIWDKYFLLGLLSFNFVSSALSQVTLWNPGWPEPSVPGSQVLGSFLVYYLIASCIVIYDSQFRISFIFIFSSSVVFPELNLPTRQALNSGIYLPLPPEF